MRLVDATAPVFARHETFYPRYSWFRKACSNTAEDPQIFSRDDATVRIGVGKNMVRSIRFWGLAAKLIVESNQCKARATREYKPTSTGSAIFGEYGSDRYLENLGTLWLIHWLLLAPRSQLPVWWIAFNEFNAVEFSETELESAVVSHLDATSEYSKPSRSSINKDVSVLLRTYVATRVAHSKFDDIFDSPLRELNLISYSDTSKKYRFNLGSKFSLCPEIFAFAVLNFIARTESGARTALVGQLAHEPGAPGKVFKLTEKDITEKLKLVIQNNSGLNLTSVAGAVQLAWSGNPIDIANDILTTYYFPSGTHQREFDCEHSIQSTIAK